MKNSALCIQYKFTKEEIIALFNKFMLETDIKFIEYLAKENLIKLTIKQKKRIIEYKNSIHENKGFIKKTTQLLGESIVLEHFKSKQLKSYQSELSCIVDFIFAVVNVKGENYSHNDRILATFFLFNNFANQLKTNLLRQNCIHNLLSEKTNIIESGNQNKWLQLDRTNFFNKRANKLINIIHNELYNRIKNDCSLAAKIFCHIADPVLNVGFSSISIMLLFLAMYKRIINNTNDVPLSAAIAKGTTIAALGILFNNMVFHTYVFSSTRSAEFLTASVMLNSLKQNEKFIEKYNALLFLYKKHTKKKFITNSAILFFCEVIVRGVVINLPFNLTNVPNDPAALLGIAVFTGASVLPISGFFEFTSAKTIAGINTEIKEFTNCVLSFTEKELIEHDVGTLYEDIMKKFKNKKTEDKSEKKYYTIALISAFLGSIITALIMISHALNDNITHRSFAINTITSMNGTMSTYGITTERNFAEKLYYNQSWIGNITSGIISLGSKTISTIAINHEFIQKPSERKVVQLNVFRYCCAFVALLIIALFGMNPGLPDLANAVVCTGTICCAMLQNNIKDEFKFKLQDTKIEEFKNYAKKCESKDIKEVVKVSVV